MSWLGKIDGWEFRSLGVEFGGYEWRPGAGEGAWVVVYDFLIQTLGTL